MTIVFVDFASVRFTLIIHCILVRLGLLVQREIAKFGDCGFSWERRGYCGYDSDAHVVYQEAMLSIFSN